MSISHFFSKLFKRNPVEIQEPPKPEERYILCIDGGGMRGIVPVVILQKLENLIRENGGSDDIAKYFDLIAGTSTGGLISLALTCPSSIKSTEYNGSSQVNLDSLLNQYLTLGRDIFQGNKINSLKQFVAEKYDSTVIQNSLQRWFGEIQMKQAKVPTLIMSYDFLTGKQHMIRSYADEADYPAWVAGRATSAAPTYFSPIEYDGKLLVDGGVIANNPATYAYFEAKKLYPNCKRFHFLSLSTGASIHTMERGGGLITIGLSFQDLLDTTQKRTTDFVLENLPDVEYVRISDPLSRDVKMDETDPTILDWIITKSKIIVIRHEEELKEYTIKLVQNMEDRKNASETGRA